MFRIYGRVGRWSWCIQYTKEDVEGFDRKAYRTGCRTRGQLRLMLKILWYRK